MSAFKLLRAVCLREVRQLDATLQSSMSGYATNQDLGRRFVERRRARLRTVPQGLNLLAIQ
jgi:hypothetical protein